jgi:hypothetical protein
MELHWLFAGPFAHRFFVGPQGLKFMGFSQAHLPIDFFVAPRGLEIMGFSSVH